MTGYISLGVVAVALLLTFVAFLPVTPLRVAVWLSRASQALVAAAMLFNVATAPDILVRIISALVLAWTVADLLAISLRARLTQARTSLTLARMEADDALTALARRDGSARSFSEIMRGIGEAADRARL